MRIALDCNRVWVDEQEADLTETEYKILKLLMQSPQRIFPVQVIYETVWGEPYFYVSNGTVMVHIRNLRMKVEHTHNVSVSMTAVDHSNETLLRYVTLMKAASEGKNISLYDLKNNTVFLSGPLRDCDYKSGFSNVDDELDFLRRICEIEEHFSVKIKIPDVIMTKDYKQVRYLSDLLRGERVKRNADEIKCTAIAGDGFRNRMKETGDAIEDLVNVGPSRVTIFGSDFDIQIVRELKNTQIMQIDKVKALLNILDNGEEFPLKLKLVTKEYYESLPSEELLSQLDKLNMPE